MTFDILGIGNPFCDRTAFVEESFLEEQGLRKGTTTPTQIEEEINASWQKAGNHDVDDHMGGSCTNVIKTLARLGTSCALHGKIGEDEVGARIKSRLKDLQVQDFLSPTKTPTGMVNCFLTPDAERTQHALFGASFELNEETIEGVKDKFSIPKLVHLEGYLAYFGNVLEKALSFSKANGKLVSLNLADRNVVQLFRNRFLACMDKVDIVFGNLKEAQELTGQKEIDNILNAFSPSQVVVITMGEKGCWVKPNIALDSLYSPALNVTGVISTIGAGDLFAGGFLYGYINQKPLEVCAKMGHLAASRVIQEVGPDLPEEKWAELRHKIQQIG